MKGIATWLASSFRARAQRVNESRTRLTLALLLAVPVALTGCSRTGIDAGKTGGRAFIVFTGMLLVTAAVLWFVLGRED